ncbi:hypothetical protein GCM10022247_10930 [Allokutzneria multivorans]|uniref:DUF3558 domain-containing protein n=1 Tax=Allokutzneria multivorans TaxID=1142134 RepID=A0ABP7R7A9_9PSEU
MEGRFVSRPRKESALLLAAVLALTGCSTPTPGEAVPSATIGLHPGKNPTARELCRLLTPADFPVQGQLVPGSPKVEEKFSPSCMYQLKTGGVGELFTGGIVFVPEVTLSQDYFSNRKEERIGGRRVALGRGDLAGEASSCGAIFDSAVGLWSIELSDLSAPNRDGCASARHVAERVIPRVP